MAAFIRIHCKQKLVEKCYYGTEVVLLELLILLLKNHYLFHAQLQVLMQEIYNNKKEPYELLENGQFHLGDIWHLAKFEFLVLENL